MRSKIAHTTLEKTEERDTLNRAVVRIVNGTARAWSIQHEIREIISPASIKQAMEMQAEAEHRKREEILQSEGDQHGDISLDRGKQQDCDRFKTPQRTMFMMMMKRTIEQITDVSRGNTAAPRWDRPVPLERLAL